MDSKDAHIEYLLLRIEMLTKENDKLVKELESYINNQNQQYD